MATEMLEESGSSPTQEAPLEEAPPAVAPPVDARWWGETALGVGDVARAIVGPLTVWGRRRAFDWSIATKGGGDGQAGEAERGRVVPEGALPDDAAIQRFSFAEAPGALLLRPALADRPVVVRPEHPLAVPSGERVTLFVSTPVWVVVSVGRPSRGSTSRRRGRRPPAPEPERAASIEDVRLLELPSYRLSDTWFGPSTFVGELCYASRTAGRLALDELPVRPHRAVTPVIIDNRAPSALVVQRLLVPIPSLALYTDVDGTLWTQGVTLTRESEGDTAITRVDNASQGAGGKRLERLAEPRTTATTGVVRAFSRLFRGGEGTGG
jgi:hypothetical protein